MPFTAKEIEELKEDHRSLAGWIKELCWQVARLNEHLEVADFIPAAPVPIEMAETPRQKRKYVRKAKIA